MQGGSGNDMADSSKAIMNKHKICVLARVSRVCVTKRQSDDKERSNCAYTSCCAEKSIL